MNHRGGTLFVKERDQCFTRTQLQYLPFGIEGRIGTECLGGCFHHCLVFRRERTQGMLYPIATLPQNGFGQIRRRLGDEIDTDTLGTNQTYNLFNLVSQSLGGILEQHVGLIEEEHHLGQIHITDFRHLVINFREQPHQKSRIQLRLKHQFVSCQDVHHATSSFSLQQVKDVKRRLTKKLLSALFGQCQQGTLDSTHRSRRYIAVGGFILLRILGHIVQHQAQVLHVDKRQLLILGNAERQGQDSRLCFVQIHQAGQQYGSHFLNGRAHGVSLFAIYVVETDRATIKFQTCRVHSPFRTPLFDELTQSSRLRNARKVTLHVGHEAGHTRLRKRLSQHLQGYCLTRARSTGNQSVPVGHLTYYIYRPFSRMGHIELLVFIHNKNFIGS